MVALPEDGAHGYIAGFLDADGTVKFKTVRGKYPACVVVWYNSYLPSLEFIRQYTGGLITSRVVQSGKSFYTLRINYAEMRVILPKIAKFLTEKQAEAIEILSYLEKRSEEEVILDYIV